jgi:hypothetical protein
MFEAVAVVSTLPRSPLLATLCPPVMEIRDQKFICALVTFDEV